MERKRVLLFEVDLCQAVQGLCQTLFQVSFFTTTNFENTYRTISTKLCVFEGNQIYLRISELEKIRSSKVDVLLKETKLDSIGIMRQNNDYSLNSFDTSYKTKSNNYESNLKYGIFCRYAEFHSLLNI